MNRGNSDPKDREKQEYVLVVRFIKVGQRKLEQIVKRQREVLSAENGATSTGFTLGEAERRKIREIINKPLLEGVVAGVVSFVVLRRIRFGLMRRMMDGKTETHPPAAPTGMPELTTSLPNASKSPFQQAIKSPNGITAEGASSKTISSTATPPPGSGGAQLPSPQLVTQNLADSRAKRISGTLFSIFGLLIEGAVSIYIAVRVLYRNPGEIVNKWGKLPLIEGRSHMAEEFCPVMLHELQVVQKEFLETNNLLGADVLKHPQSQFMAGLLQFCHNCQVRAAYEQQLRLQWGLSNSDPVSIPSPGVSTIRNPALLPDFGGRINASGDESANDFYDPRDEQNDWADPFVTDQEEQANNERDRKG